MKTDEKGLEIKVGIFLTIGLALILSAILILGGQKSIFQSTRSYTSHFSKVDGLVQGAKVLMGGLLIGSVDEVDFDAEERNIVVHLSIESKYAQWVRKDSSLEIMTQGVLGDKYLSLLAGSASETEIPEGGEINAASSRDLTQLFTTSEKLVHTLGSVAVSFDRILEKFEQNGRAQRIFENLAVSTKNLGELTQKLNHDLDSSKLKSSVMHLNSILEKIDNGRGTLGAFINDPGIYDDTKALVGQTNRNRIMRNLIRQTIKESDQPGQGTKQ
jgi:phospholipid/cholesterol/gamma-HCH transport system substrate-binding protein